VDMRAKVKMLVQQAVNAYLKEQLQENNNRSIAILLGYQSTNPLVVLEAVTPLIESYNVTLLLSKEWASLSAELSGNSYVLLEEATQQELKAIVEKTSILVVPVASFRLISKLALTVDDEPSVWIAIQYQLEGKPIVIANNDIKLNVNQQILAPHSFQTRLQTYIRQIQADQVKWVPLSKLANTVDEQYQGYQKKRSLILAKHIEAAHQDGLKEIVIPLNYQVTPAAKDAARELNIQINRRESSKGG
jgi:hypothetical protein